MMEIKTLGEVCNIASGGTPSRSKSEYWNEGTIPWIKIGNIKGKYVNEADEFITQEAPAMTCAIMSDMGRPNFMSNYLHPHRKKNMS